MAVLNWEEMASSGGPSSVRASFYRANVPGGWLITFEGNYYLSVDEEHFVAGGMTFLPDPDHKWDGGNT